VISTFQALAVTLLFILPGAAYTFALERVGGSCGVKLADRIFASWRHRRFSRH
jgi:hypothetical protein